MTYVVDEKCIKCKTTDCVAVCPVNCFYDGENMLVIHPDECIDCGVCEPECPVSAIKPDTEESIGYELARQHVAVFLQRTAALQNRLTGPPHIPEERFELLECDSRALKPPDLVFFR